MLNVLFRKLILKSNIKIRIMLKANDLRVGNKVYYNTGESIEVHLIDSVDIKLAEQYNLLFNANHSPIPLTEEWLIKMGFEKTPYEFKNDNFSFNFKYSSLYNSVALIKDDVKYVHQMQNLIYALTNEELTIL